MDFLELLQRDADYKKVNESASARGIFANVEQLEEAGTTYQPSTGDLTLTVIKPGWSKNNRYYPAALLKQRANIFEGAKMFVDHATDAQDKQRPEGSVKDWVGTITGVKVESDGTVKATANIHNEAFKQNLTNLKKAGNLNQMGVSIRAFGEAKDGEAEGRKGKIVESLHGGKSVDFVTFAAAGGVVESMSEAVEPNDLLWINGGKTNDPCTKGDKIVFDAYLKAGKITEAEHRKMTGQKPEGYDKLTDTQKKEFNGARLIGISEADAFTLARMVG
jgi:hypothetical protein